ncbi:hypothetical protein M011DRAFT_45338 [Sporormia fimetaria CBS 119925]|uniref:Uncharacterized protein n=1 Tax=Sporormia fimetaria CBS 119925 TaxID=1340428 RepID=A0A6A6VA50_9PLEO|nr:hypothetical protein M011DRAFT_45338 [Sporormia fimetaria CBS 119925]
MKPRKRKKKKSGVTPQWATIVSRLYPWVTKLLCDKCRAIPKIHMREEEKFAESKDGEQDHSWLRHDPRIVDNDDTLGLFIRVPETINGGLLGTTGYFGGCSDIDGETQTIGNASSRAHSTPYTRSLLERVGSAGRGFGAISKVTVSISGGWTASSRNNGSRSAGFLAAGCDGQWNQGIALQRGGRVLR